MNPKCQSICQLMLLLNLLPLPIWPGEEDLRWWWRFLNNPKEWLTNCPAVGKTRTTFVCLSAHQKPDFRRHSHAPQPRRWLTWSCLRRGARRDIGVWVNTAKMLFLKWMVCYKAAMTCSYRANSFPVARSEACKCKAEEVLGTSINVAESVKHLPSPQDLRTDIPHILFYQSCSMLSSELHQLCVQQPLETCSLEKHPLWP